MKDDKHCSNQETMIVSCQNQDYTNGPVLLHVEQRTIAESETGKCPVFFPIHMTKLLSPIAGPSGVNTTHFLVTCC